MRKLFTLIYSPSNCISSIHNKRNFPGLQSSTGLNVSNSQPGYSPAINQPVSPPMLNRLRKMLTTTRINSASMIVEKIIVVGINLVVFAILARSFGPELFGVFALVQAVFGIGRPVALAAGEQMLLKYQVGKKRSIGPLQSTALKLKYASSIAVYSITLLVSYLYFDTTIFNLVAIYCIVHFVNVDIIFFSHFRATERGHIVLFGRIAILIPFGILKAFVAYKYSSLTMIAWLFVSEALVLSISAIILYRLFSKTSPESEITYTKTRELASASWPIFSSALIVALYTRIDQFMIESYLSRTDLGYYSSVVKINHASQYVLSTYLLSRFPMMLRLYRRSIEEYKQAMVKIMRLVILFCSVYMVFLLFFSEQLISLIYGTEYLPAKNSLIALAMGTFFVYYGLLCTQWLLAHDLQIHRLYRVIGGLLINIVLNIWMIPAYGILGAAVATIISQAASSVLFNAFHHKTRPIFRLQLQSFMFGR